MYLSERATRGQIGSYRRRQGPPTSDAWCASKLFSVRHELWELKDERDHRPIARGGKRGRGIRVRLPRIETLSFRSKKTHRFPRGGNPCECGSDGATRSRSVGRARGR